MIYLTEQATVQQIQKMLAQYSTMIKIVVDIRRGILAGGVKCTLIVKMFSSMQAVNKMTYGEQTGILLNNGLNLNR